MHAIGMGGEAGIRSGKPLRKLVPAQQDEYYDGEVSEEPAHVRPSIWNHAQGNMSNAFFVASSRTLSLAA